MEEEGFRDAGEGGCRAAGMRLGEDQVQGKRQGCRDEVGGQGAGMRLGQGARMRLGENKVQGGHRAAGMRLGGR